MRARSPHEIIGVPRGASPEQIRRAYLLKVKEVHPDKFDQVRQRVQWEAANEQIKELNEAYAALKEGDGAAGHAGGPRSAGQAAPRPRPPDWDLKLGRLKAGMAWFANLPKSLQDRILERTTGAEKNQYAIPIGGIGWNYFFLLVLLAWLYVALDFGRMSYHWGADDATFMLGGTLVCASLQAWNICRLVKWHRSSLRPTLIITPLYVIRTSLDRVWYWPIWTLTAVRATHNYTNSSYTGTSLNMEFGDDKQSCTIRPQEAYASLVAMLNVFGRRVDAAKAQDDVRYFFEQDDFREFDPEKSPPRESAHRSTLVICAATLLVYSGAYLLAISANRDKPENTYARPTSGHPSPRRPYVPPPSVVAAPTYPEFALPEDGAMRVYSAQERLAPFQIMAPYGSHCLAKLVDASTSQPVLTVFVRAGSTTKVHVPLGTYTLKFAQGDKWYGDTHLFGPSTGYGKADTRMTFSLEGDRYQGHSVVLQKAVGGNLRTEAIPAGEF